MKKKIILLSVLILLCAGGFVSALAEELHGSVGVIYDSKYIWRGIDVYGDKSAIHPFIDLDLFGTGFGMNITIRTDMKTLSDGIILSITIIVYLTMSRMQPTICLATDTITFLIRAAIQRAVQIFRKCMVFSPGLTFSR
jgi:hypothetical protein